MKYKSVFLVTLHCLKMKGLCVGGEKVKEDWVFDLLEFICLGYSSPPESRVIGRMST